jgi:hypothetical protein
VLGPTIVHAGADGFLVFANYNMDLTGEGSTFLFSIFLVCCMLGEAKVPSQCLLRMLCTVLPICSIMGSSIFADWKNSMKDESYLL